MSEDRLILAIGRLERALARVETVASRPRSETVTTDPEVQANLATLTSRHEKLKQQVEGAIAALDRIIAKG